MSYLTQADVQAKLGKALTTEQASYFNDTLLPAIEVYINTVTGISFGNTTDSTVYVSGDGSNLLVIPTMSAVTSIYAVDESDVETLVDPTAYTVYPRGIGPIYALRNKAGTWVDGFDNYKLAGKLGYADVPEDIKAIALEMATTDILQNLTNYKSERVGDWSVTYSDTGTSAPLSDTSLMLLQSYRRLSRSV